MKLSNVLLAVYVASAFFISKEFSVQSSDAAYALLLVLVLPTIGLIIGSAAKPLNKLGCFAGLLTGGFVFAVQAVIIRKYITTTVLSKVDINSQVVTFTLMVFLIGAYGIFFILGIREELIEKEQ